MLKKVARNAAAQALGLLITFADRFIAVSVLLRAWGTDLYSDWASLLSLTGLVSLGEMGLNIYYGNVFQKAWSTHDAGAFQRSVSIALFVNAVLTACLALLASAAVYLIGVQGTLSIRAMPASEIDLVVLFLAMTTLSRVARGAISQIFRGRQEFAVGALVDQVALGSAMLVAVAAGVSGSAPSLTAATLAATDLAAGWGLMVFAIKRRYPGLALVPARPTRAEAAHIARLVPWLAIQQGAPLVWLQLPVIFLNHIDIAAVSLVGFLLLRTVVNFMRSVATMLSIGSGVEIAATYHRGAHAEAYRGISEAGFGLSVVSTAIACGLVLFGEELIEVWTGSRALYDQRILLSLLAGALFAAPSATVGAQMMYANAPRPQSTALLAQVVVGLTACLALARICGAPGAAAGLAVGEALGQGVVLPLLGREAMPGFAFGAYLRRCAIAMLATSCWCLAVGMVVKGLLQPRSLPGLAAVITVWGTIAVLPMGLAVLPRARRKLGLATRLMSA